MALDGCCIISTLFVFNCRFVEFRTLHECDKAISKFNNMEMGNGIQLKVKVSASKESRMQRTSTEDDAFLSTLHCSKTTKQDSVDEDCDEFEMDDEEWSEVQNHQTTSKSSSNVLSHESKSTPVTPQVTPTFGAFSRGQQLQSSSNNLISPSHTDLKPPSHFTSKPNTKPSPRVKFDDSLSGPCDCCGSMTTKKCAVCKTHFCSTDCQTVSWPEHRKMCRDIAQKKETQKPTVTNVEDREPLKIAESDEDDGFVVSLPGDDDADVNALSNLLGKSGISTSALLGHHRVSSPSTPPIPNNTADVQFSSLPTLPSDTMQTRFSLPVAVDEPAAVSDSPLKPRKAKPETNSGSSSRASPAESPVSLGASSLHQVFSCLMYSDLATVFDNLGCFPPSVPLTGSLPTTFPAYPTAVFTCSQLSLMPLSQQSQEILQKLVEFEKRTPTSFLCKEVTLSQDKLYGMVDGNGHCIRVQMGKNSKWVSYDTGSCIQSGSFPMFSLADDIAKLPSLRVRATLKDVKAVFEKSDESRRFIEKQVCGKVVQVRNPRFVPFRSGHEILTCELLSEDGSISYNELLSCRGYVVKRTVSSKPAFTSTQPKPWGLAAQHKHQGTSLDSPDVSGSEHNKWPISNKPCSTTDQPKPRGSMMQNQHTTSVDKSADVSNRENVFKGFGNTNTTEQLRPSSAQTIDESSEIPASASFRSQSSFSHEAEEAHKQHSSSQDKETKRHQESLFSPSQESVPHTPSDSDSHALSSCVPPQSKCDPPVADLAKSWGIAPPIGFRCAHYSKKVPFHPLKDLVFDIYPTVILSPALIWAQVVHENSYKLRELLEDMNNQYRHTNNGSYIPRTGELCVARFHLDNMFYRAEVLRVNNNGLVDVLFVDYGNTETVKFTELRHCKSIFLTLPKQALRFSMSGVSPPPDAQQWSDEATSLLKETIFEKPVGVRMVHCDLQLGKVSVCILDPSDPQSTLNDLLVKRGLAVSVESQPPQTQGIRNASVGRGSAFNVTKTPLLGVARLPGPPQQLPFELPLSSHYRPGPNLPPPPPPVSDEQGTDPSSSRQFSHQSGSTLESSSTASRLPRSRKHHQTEAMHVRGRTQNTSEQSSSTSPHFRQSKDKWIKEQSHSRDAKPFSSQSQQQGHSHNAKPFSSQELRKRSQSAHWTSPTKPKPFSNDSQVAPSSARNNSRVDTPTSPQEPSSIMPPLSSSVSPTKPHFSNLRASTSPTKSPMSSDAHKPARLSTGSSQLFHDDGIASTCLPAIAPVLVSHVDSPSHFFVQVIDEKVLSALCDLSEELQVVKHKPLLGVSERQLCIAKYSEDNSYNRAKVIRVAKSSALVQFLDYGNTTDVALDELYIMEQSYTKLPCQAVLCSLSGICSLNGDAQHWDRDACSEFGLLVKDKEVTAEKVGEDSEKTFVNLMVTSASGSLISACDHLVEKGLALNSTSRSQIRQHSTSKSPLSTPRLVSSNIPSFDSIPATELESATYLTVVVAEVISPAKLYVQLFSHAEEIVELTESLNRHFAQNPPSQSLPFLKVDSVCCTQFSQDQAWYRGRVLSATSDAYLLQFIDYGNCEIVKVGDVTACPAQFCNIPVQAVCCLLEGVAPTGDDWDPQAAVFLTEFCKNKLLSVLVKEKLSDKYVVQLVDTSTSVDVMVATELVRLGLAVDTSGPPSLDTPTKSVSFACSPPPPHSFGDNFEAAVVTEVSSPLSFWVQLASTDCQQRLMHVQSALNAASQQFPPFIDSSLLSVGDYCCAMFSEDDTWYRAQVVELLREAARVVFIDFGNSESVNFSNIHPLPEELTTQPRLAYNVSLMGVTNLTANAKQVFTELTSGKILCVKVVAPRGDGLDLAQLVDTSQNIDVDIAEELIRLGAAFPISTPALSLKPSTGSQEHSVAVTNSLPSPKPAAGSQEFPVVLASSLKVVPLPASQEFRALVTHVESPLQVFVQILDGNIQNLKDLAEAVSAFSVDAPVLSGQVKKGQIVLAPFDGEFFRGKLVGKQENQFTVVFIDFGNREKVPRNGLRPVSEALCAFPVQAVKCAVIGVPPQYPVDQLKRLLNQQVVCSVVCLEPLMVNLKLKDGRPAINSHLSDSSFLYRLPHTHLPARPTPILVTHVTSPQSFFLQVVDRAAALELGDLSTQLQHTCPALPQLPSVVVGQLCCALFSEDQCWYRARVTEVYDSSVKVAFVDFGNTEEIALSSLRPIDEENLVLPAQSVWCSLLEVESLVGQHPMESARIFKELVTNRQLIATYKKLNEHCQSLVLLQDPSTGDADILKLIVQKLREAL